MPSDHEHVLLMFHFSSPEKVQKSVQKACFRPVTNPLCKENHDQHDSDDENRQGGPKQVRIGTASDRKSIKNTMPFPPIDRKRAGTGLYTVAVRLLKKGLRILWAGADTGPLAGAFNPQRRLY